MTPHSAVLRAAAALVLAAGASSCGATDAGVGVGDPADAYRVIREQRVQGPRVLEPRSLVDALPNREIVVGSPGHEVRARFSDLVVEGTITEVEPGEGVVYPNDDPTSPKDEEAGTRIVAFDDPDAVERSARVTMRVDWSAGSDVGDVLEFRIGVPYGADPEAFLADVHAIDDAIVLLARIRSGRNTGEYYPILARAGLGSVAEDGTIAFPGLGDEAREFAGGIDTVDEIRAEAARPVMTIAY